MLRSSLAGALTASLFILALAGCPSKHTTFAGALLYGQDAAEDYQFGLDEMKAEAWPDATKFFEHVRLKYPFSKFSVLSELRLADVKYSQGHYLEAAEAYAAFLQLHPTSEEADYADYRCALCHYKEAPTDFFLFPKVQEKDQREVEKAVKILEEFVRAREKSKYLNEAKTLLTEARSRLAAHEWYVAEYYFKADRWPGAAGRYLYLVDKYPGSEHEAEALLKLAKSYLHMEEKFRARTALQRLIFTHPQDPQRPEAEKLLASLR